MQGREVQSGTARDPGLGAHLLKCGRSYGGRKEGGSGGDAFPSVMQGITTVLGDVELYEEIIPGYSALSQPLTSEVNTLPANWPRAAMEAAFEKMKTAVADQLSLAHLDYSKAIFLSADASCLGVGGCLENRWRGEDGEWVVRVVACASHSFTPAEARWATIEQEAFVLIWICMFFRAPLFGQPFVLETDHRNLTFIHGGTSPKVVRWAMALQNFCYTLIHVPGVNQHVADALSRAPQGCEDHDTEALRLTDFEVVSPTEARPVLGALTAQLEESQRRPSFAMCHNATQGHHGLQRTLEELRALGREWPRMSRDVATWIKYCPECQKIRAREPPAGTLLSPIGAFAIFEELSIDFVGPLPEDDVGNSYILNCVCSTTRYCELFAVEAATATVAAHCLLAVAARYGCFRQLRFDRGSHFVNEILAEFLRLFEMEQILTLAQRPQANALAERNGAEVMRHLRALVLEKKMRDLWSVMLPLVMRVLNKTFRTSVGATPHRLLHWAPTDLDRGIFAPFQETTTVPPLSTDFVRALESGYEHLLDVSARHILEEQDKIREAYGEVVEKDIEVGTLVLMSYLVRPPSKLHCRWEGPFAVMERRGNTAVIRDLTNDATREVDLSRLRVFLVAPGVDPKAVAAADLGEAEVQGILDHRGTAKKRAAMEFLVSWTDGEQTWESWATVKKLEHIDLYIRTHPHAGLKALLPKK